MREVIGENRNGEEINDGNREQGKVRKNMKWNRDKLAFRVEDDRNYSSCSSLWLG